jgi:enoyl-CoA hydratase/carnithine racemase
MISPLVIVAVEHAVGQITLNRPDKRNALTAAMLQHILDGLDCFKLQARWRRSGRIDPRRWRCVLFWAGFG